MNADIRIHKYGSQWIACRDTPDHDCVTDIHGMGDHPVAALRDLLRKGNA